MSAQPPPEIVTDWIRDHVRLIHALAAPLAGKGVIVVTGFGEDPDEIHPKTRKPGRQLRPKVSHAAIGEIKEALTAVAQFVKEHHYNLYMPLAIYGPDLPSGAKGLERDIVACLGIVADFDDPDAARWAERLPIPPNYVLETSEGRFQAFYLFDKPEALEVVKPVAKRLKAFARCDHGTSDISHVWRVPGALNWPNAKKVAEGRSPDPQLVRVEKWDDSRTSLQSLSDALRQGEPTTERPRAISASGARHPRCLDAALDYAERGFSVIVLYGIDDEGICACGKPGCFRAGNHPIGEWKKYQTKRQTREQLIDAFNRHPDANVGIITGDVSGVLVVDSDDSEGLDALCRFFEVGLPTLPTVKTEKGYHIYGRHPGGTLKDITKIRPGLDGCGDGGYVIAPPSRDGSGHEYTWTTFLTSPLPDLPVDLLNLFAPSDKQPDPTPTPGAGSTRKTRRQQAANGNVRSPHQAAVDGTPENLDAQQRMLSLPVELQEEVKRAAAGDRSKVLFSVIAKMISHGLEDKAIENIVYAHPKGIGAKYADRNDLDKDISRIRAKSSIVAARPIVQVRGGALPTIIDQAEEHLVKGGYGLFQRGSLIVRPVQDRVPRPDGDQIVNTRLVQVRLQPMREHFSKAVDFQRLVRRSWVSIDCPRDVAEAYLEREGKWRLPRLTRIITTPTLRPDGSVLEMPGYDEATGLLFEPQGVAFPPVPMTPDFFRDVLPAANLLLGLLKTFPFVDESSRAVALSAVLTSLVRASLPSAPLHAFTAPTAGSGKSLLVDIASMISTGQETPVMAQGRTAEEFEKRLGAAFIAGDGTISIDNCEQPLGGEFLCQVLTQSLVSIRILGQSKNVKVPTICSVFATGNNLRIIGDLTRRTIVSSLDAECERPELRDFVEDPLELIRRSRPRYVAAALTILRFAVITKLPEWCTRTPLASFGEWSRWVREAIIYVTDADPCDTMDRARAQDPEREMLRSVAHQWASAVGDRRVSVAEVIDIATKLSSEFEPDQNRFVNHAFREALLVIAGNGGAIDSRRLGTWLGRHKDRIVDGKKIIPDGILNGNNQWRLVHVSGSSNGRAEEVGPLQIAAQPHNEEVR